MWFTIAASCILQSAGTYFCVKPCVFLHLGDQGSAINSDKCESVGASAGRGPRKEEEGQAAEAAASCDEDISSENDSEGGSSQGTDESHENARLHNSDQIGAQMRVDNDENSSQQSQWWLEAPPPGGRQFRTVMLPSQFIEQEYQLYRCVLHESFQVSDPSNCRGLRLASLSAYMQIVDYRWFSYTASKCMT